MGVLTNHGVCLWGEVDVLDSWQPLYCGEIEELLDCVGVITLSNEGDGFIAWGGSFEDYCEAVQKLPSVLWNRELATLYNGNVLIWGSVQAFYDACTAGPDHLKTIAERLLEEEGGGDE